MPEPRCNPLHRHGGPVLALLAAAALAACAERQPATQSGLLGVGTPGVASHMPTEEPTSVQALLERCGPMSPESGPPPAPQSFAAACDELHRTLHNQPGNAASGNHPASPGG